MEIITYYKIYLLVKALLKAKKEGKTLKDFKEIVKSSDVDFDDILD